MIADFKVIYSQPEPEQPPEPQKITRPDIGLTVPTDGRYFQIQHDWILMDGDTRASKNPHSVKNNISHPAIAKSGLWVSKSVYNGRFYDYVELPEIWQRFLYDLWAWSVRGGNVPVGEILGYETKTTNTGTFAITTYPSLTWYYVNMMEKSRAFTDSWSPEVGGRDYVTNRNPQNRPLEFLLRTCTGNLTKLQKINGREYWVEALDILKPPPPLEWLITQPHLLHWCTEVSPRPLPDKTYTVSNFPQAEKCLGVPSWGVPLPFMSLGGTVIFDKAAVRELTPGQKYSPYNPQR